MDNDELKSDLAAIREELMIAREDRAALRAAIAVLISEQRSEAERRETRHERGLERLTANFPKNTGRRPFVSPNSKASRLHW